MTITFLFHLDNNFIVFHIVDSQNMKLNEDLLINLEDQSLYNDVILPS